MTPDFVIVASDSRPFYYWFSLFRVCDVTFFWWTLLDLFKSPTDVVFLVFLHENPLAPLFLPVCI